MWHWTIRNLKQEWGAFIISVSAIAGALSLVLLFEAVYAGETAQIVAYPYHADADVWVMQRGVSNMHMATSYVAGWKLSQIRVVPGVADAEGILYMNTVIEAGDQRWFSYVVGIDPTSIRGGPWAMSEGNRNPGAGEAVVPALFSEVSGISLDDLVKISDRSFRVVGFSVGTFSIANSVVFVDRRDLEDMMHSVDILSYILVKAAPGIDPTALAGEIEQEIDDVTALASAEFIQNDRQLAVQMGVETIALMTVIGGILAILLIAFTAYSHIARKRLELAVVKALGATNLSLLLAISLQIVLIALASVLLSSVLAATVLPILGAIVPQVTFKLTVVSLLKNGLIGVCVALVSALISSRQIFRVDPLSAFSR